MANGKRRGRGEGSIEELPSGKFRAIRSGGKDAEGNRVKEAKTFDTKREALTWLRRALSDVRGEWAGRLLVEWLDHWLAVKKPDVEPNTYRGYEQRVRLHLKPRLAGVTLGGLRAVQVQSWLKAMAADGVPAGERYRSLKVLRAALAEAVRIDQIGRNAAKQVPLPRQAKREMQCLDEDQARRLLEATRTDRLAALYVVELDAGLRPGELFALHWDDIDWTRGMLRVSPSLEEIAGCCRLKAPKTDKSRRTIGVARRTLAALEGHRERMRAEGRDVTGGPVFCNTTGG
jgi:integrase